jgi:hypothetical protein
MGVSFWTVSFISILVSQGLYLPFIAIFLADRLHQASLTEQPRPKKRRCCSQRSNWPNPAASKAVSKGGEEGTAVHFEQTLSAMLRVPFLPGVSREVSAQDMLARSQSSIALPPGFHRLDDDKLLERLRWLTSPTFSGGINRGTTMPCHGRPRPPTQLVKSE